MPSSVRSQLLLLLVAVVVAACGFHLQPEAELPAEMERVRLEIQNPYSTFARRMRILLEQGGVSVVEDESATAILRIPRNQVRKEILTIGDNARVREYRLRHTVEFSLLDRDGDIVVPEQQLEQSRVLSFDEQDILGAAQEDEQLRREMADTLARLVLRRLGGARA
jgi:LPS-assembly lipoprotein